MVTLLTEVPRLTADGRIILKYDLLKNSVIVRIGTNRLKMRSSDGNS